MTGQKKERDLSSSIGNQDEFCVMEFNEVVFTKVPLETRKHHRRFFDRHVRKMFIKYLAYTNQFDGVLSEKEIEQAKIGYLPPDLDIHHVFPIAGSDSEDVNAFMNLSVIHKTTHIKINKEIFAPQLKEIDKMPDGSKILIKIPLFDAVDAEGILKAREQMKQKSKSKTVVHTPNKSFTFPFWQKIQNSFALKM